MKFECSSRILQAGWIDEDRIVVATASGEVLAYDVYPYGQEETPTAGLYRGPDVLFNAPRPQHTSNTLVVEPGAFAVHPKGGCAIAYEDLVALVSVTGLARRQYFPEMVTS